MRKPSEILKIPDQNSSNLPEIGMRKKSTINSRRNKRKMKRSFTTYTTIPKN